MPCTPFIGSRRTFFTSGNRTDTIYALSSAQGKAGIAVIRISGPLCKRVSRPPQSLMSLLVANNDTRYMTASVRLDLSQNRALLE